jgi:thioredoxin
MLYFVLSKIKKSFTIEKNSHSTLDWPDHILTLDNKKIITFIEKYPLSVVDFWAPWCNPCKTMSPRLRRLAMIYRNRLAFGKLNTMDNKDIAKSYKIIGIPHLAFFSYGKKIKSITGVKTVGELKNIIDELLKKI